MSEGMRTTEIYSSVWL